MEVHHHPHVEKKNFKEYLLEGLMIFVAVSMGFIAENIRENIVENRNQKEYIEEYRNDLIRNQYVIHKIDSFYISMIPVYDTICSIYHTRRENSNIKKLDTLLVVGKRTILTQISTPTYSQLLNSAGLKYIRNVALRDSMATYFDQINRIRDFDLRLMQLKNTIYPEILKIEDLHDFWKIDANNPENIYAIPDIDTFEPMTEAQRRIVIGYYRQYFIQMRSDHMMLKEIMRLNHNLIELIDKN